ncbi:MAG TPA: response regulator [Terriglobales bacterium]|nr:response regulator [Terriglobales bacterium]
MALILKRSGYQVIEATTGLEAIEQARGAIPDLILMDLALPGLMGDEVIARLKKDPTTKEIPVIVNTAFHKESAIVERAIALGVTEVLHKPLSFIALQEMARRYLSNDNSDKQYPAHNHPTSQRSAEFATESLDVRVEFPNRQSA